MNIMTGYRGATEGEVIINGHVFTAEDCGGAIKGIRIDIYVNDHNKALELGVDHADVYLVK